MDFKKIVDQVKDKAEDLKETAEAKIKATRENLDKDQLGARTRVCVFAGLCSVVSLHFKR